MSKALALLSLTVLSSVYAAEIPRPSWTNHNRIAGSQQMMTNFKPWAESVESTLGDKRNKTDNVCHNTEYSDEWVANLPLGHSFENNSKIEYGGENGWYVWLRIDGFGPSQATATGPEDAVSLDFRTTFGSTFTATRPTLCKSNDTFVTWSPMTNAVANLIKPALDDKRDEDDLNVYYRAFTGRENWTLKRDSQEYELEYVSEGYWKHDYTEPGFYDYIRIRNGTNFEYGENVGTGEHAIWYDDYNQFQEHPEYIDMSGIRTYVSRTPQGSIKPTSDRLATTNGVNEAIASATNDSSIVRAPLNEYGQRVFSEPLFVPPGTDDFNINATTYFYDPVSIYNISFLRDSNGNDVLNTLANKADRATTLSGYGITDATPLSMISETDPTFSNAVLAVGLNIDTNSVAVLNEIASTFGGFPIEGTATTVGGLLAALAAAIAWLKKNKVQTLKLENGSVETSADGGVAKLDDFFTNSNSLLTETIDDRLPIPISAKSEGFTTESYKRFVVTVGGDMTVTLHTPTSGDAEIFECRFNGSSLSADASITFAGATATTMDANCGTVTAGKVAMMSAFWNGTTWDVNWKVEG